MSDNSRARSDGTRLWVSAAFFVFAAGMFLASSRVALPIGSPAAIPASAVDPTPVRRPQSSPTYKIGEYTYRCSECHKSIPSPAETDRRLTPAPGYQAAARHQHAVLQLPSSDEPRRLR